MVVTTSRKNLKKRQKVHTWLRKRISPLDFGFKHSDGKPVHANPNYEVLDKLNGGRGWLARLSNADMDAHFSGEHTYYFAGNGSRKSDESLAMIDIDCHKRGTHAGAMAFAEYLRTKPLFDALYVERSTNGVGVHGYPVVSSISDDRTINVALKVLDLYLKGLSYLTDFDLELVEVKGMCPELTWGKERGHLEDYKSGTLAKLPREAIRRADELMDTSRLTVPQLIRLGINLADEAEASGVPAEIVDRIRTAAEPLIRRPWPEHLARLREAVKHLEQWKWGRSAEPTTIPVTLPIDPAGADDKRFRDGKTREKARGSTEAPTVSDEIAGLIRTKLLRFAKNWCNSGLRSGKGRWAVPLDVSALIAILAHTKDHPNRDGSIPTAWIKLLWEDLVERGYIDRPWDHHRYKAARDFLSKMGWLIWHDQDYVVGREVNGVYRKGKAAKWEATDFLRSIAEVEEDNVDDGEDRGGEKEEGHIYGQHHDDPDTLSFVERLRIESGLWGTPRFAGYSGQSTSMAA